MRRPCSILLLVVASCSTPAEVARRSIAAPPEPIARGLLGDLHVHVTMKRALAPFTGLPGGPLASHPDVNLVNQVDPQALLANNLRVVIASVWPPPATRPGRSAMDETLRQLEQLEAFAREQPLFAIALTAADARRIAASGRIALVPAVEGAEAIREVADVDRLHAAGARSIGLVHFVDNELGDARDRQFGPVAGLLLDGSTRGLTPLGRRAVSRMFELGILVDLAHGSASLADDVLSLAEAARAPIISSHEGAGMGFARTLSDEHARRIAGVGGLIGVGLYRSDLLTPVPAEDRFDGFVEGTCDESLAHWLHFERVAGPEAVVLGSDLSAPIQRGRPGGGCAEGLRSSIDLGSFFSALIRRGASAAHLAHSGDRILQVLEVLERRSASAPAGRRSPARGAFEIPP